MSGIEREGSNDEVIAVVHSPGGHVAVELHGIHRRSIRAASGHPAGACCRSPWLPGHATFYGGSDASGTFNGSCGYGNTYTTGYGVATTTVSPDLYEDGVACGKALRVVCDYTLDPQFCIQGKSVTVTVTGVCTPPLAPPVNGEPACGPEPLSDLELSEPAWLNIGIYVGGVVPVLYQNVPAQKHGGLKFTMSGTDRAVRALVFNVAGAGATQAVWVKGSSTDWIPMTRTAQGAVWEADQYLAGQSLSFMVETVDGETRICDDVAPSTWAFGQTYTSSVQF